VERKTAGEKKKGRAGVSHCQALEGKGISKLELLTLDLGICKKLKNVGSY